ncbi:MAG: hypothetical protein AB1846_12370, partial [Chloroflexota bacterium]
MDLRDPIWQGFEAVITIAGILVTAIFVIVPGLRERLIKTVRSSFFLFMLFLLIIFCLCIFMFFPTVQGIASLIATSTPTPTITPLPTPIPTETLVPTPEYNYLVFDNFDGGPLPAWRPISGTWQMVNNQLPMLSVRLNGVRGNP